MRKLTLHLTPKEAEEVFTAMDKHLIEYEDDVIRGDMDRRLAAQYRTARRAMDKLNDARRGES